MLGEKPDGMSWEEWGRIEESHSNYHHPYQGGEVLPRASRETHEDVLRFRREAGITNPGASGQPPRSFNRDYDNDAPYA